VSERERERVLDSAPARLQYQNWSSHVHVTLLSLYNLLVLSFGEESH
jgi:hypothetical protein